LARDRIVSEQRNSYNPEGKITEEWRLNSVDLDQTYTSKKTFEYNDKGYLIKITDYLNDEFRTVKNLNYNNLGKLISETQSNEPSGTKALTFQISLNGTSEKLFYGNANEVTGKEISIKNEKGDIIRYEIRNAQGEVNHATSYLYNDLNQAIYVLKDDVVGHMKEETHSSYNSSRLIDIDSTFLNKRLIGKTLYQHTNGFLSSKTKIDRDNKVEYEISYTNNTKGLNLEEKFSYHGELINSIKRTYDIHDNLVMEERFNTQNQLLQTKNWEYSCPN
jgi:hypothetical protein